MIEERREAVSDRLETFTIQDDTCSISVLVVILLWTFLWILERERKENEKENSVQSPSVGSLLWNLYGDVPLHYLLSQCLYGSALVSAEAGIIAVTDT